MAVRLMGNFSQGPKLKKQYEFNSKMHGGICFSLMVQWYKLLQENADVASDLFGTLLGNPAQDRMDELDRDFKLSGGRQMAYTSGLSVSKIQTTSWGAFGTSMAQVLTGMGRHYGVRFTYLLHGPNSATLSNYVGNATNAGKTLYLSIKFTKGGGHAIGFRTATPQLCFDPNVGEFEYDRTSSANFAAWLWNAYAGTNGGIKHMLLFEMTTQQSTFDFWENLQ